MKIKTLLLLTAFVVSVASVFSLQEMRGGLGDGGAQTESMRKSIFLPPVIITITSGDGIEINPYLAEIINE